MFAASSVTLHCRGGVLQSVQHLQSRRSKKQMEEDRRVNPRPLVASSHNAASPLNHSTHWFGDAVAKPHAQYSNVLHSDMFGIRCVRRFASCSF